MGQARDAQAMIDMVADYYADQTGVLLDQHDESASIVIAIAGVSSGKDYVALEQTLAGLNALQNVHLGELKDDTLVFDARLAASEQALINELTANREIRLMAPQERAMRMNNATEPRVSGEGQDSMVPVSEGGSEPVNQMPNENDRMATLSASERTMDKRLWFVWQPSQ